MSSLSSSPSPTIPTTNATVVRHRGVRMPNELLRELAQCVPMEWFVSGSSQAKQHRHHGIVQLGTAMGTYLSRIHGKFAKVVAKQIREIPSIPKMKRSSSSTSSAESEEQQRKIRENIAELSEEQQEEFLSNALADELSVEERVELQNKIKNMHVEIKNVQIKALGDKLAVKKRQSTVQHLTAYLDKRRKMSEHKEEEKREEVKIGGETGAAEKTATDESIAGAPSTSSSPRRRKCQNPTKEVPQSCVPWWMDADCATPATSSSQQPNLQQDEEEKTE